MRRVLEGHLKQAAGEWGTTRGRDPASSWDKHKLADLVLECGEELPIPGAKNARHNAQAIDIEISDSEATRLDEASRRWR